MTNDQTVTQADRDAADEHYPPHLWKKAARDDLAIAFARHRTSHSGEGRSNGAGEPLASIVVKLSAIRTVLREAHWALDDSEDMSHQDPPVHAVPLDNVMRLHRALKACERFASTDEAWDGPGPLVTKIIEWLGATLTAPQGEVERLRKALAKRTFLTCVSGDGQTPYLKVHFNNLSDAHAAQDELLGRKS